MSTNRERPYESLVLPRVTKIRDAMRAQQADKAPKDGEAHAQPADKAPKETDTPAEDTDEEDMDAVWGQWDSWSSWTKGLN